MTKSLLTIILYSGIFALCNPLAVYSQPPVHFFYLDVHQPSISGGAKVRNLAGLKVKFEELVAISGDNAHLFISNDNSPTVIQGKSNLVQAISQLSTLNPSGPFHPTEHERLDRQFTDQRMIEGVSSELVSIGGPLNFFYFLDGPSAERYGLEEDLVAEMLLVNRLMTSDFSAAGGRRIQENCRVVLLFDSESKPSPEYLNKLQDLYGYEIQYY